MSRLLNADFARLFRSRLFRVCAVFSALYGAGKIIWNIIFPNSTYVLVNNRDLHLFDMDGIEILIITAIFICLFIGQEYDGALRNKIIVGKTRLSIYLANLITCLAAAAIFYILFASFLLITFVFSGGTFVLSLSTMALYMLLQLFSILSASAVFTALAMLIHRKSASAVTALVLLFVLFMADAFCNSRLNVLEGNIHHYDPITDSFTDIDCSDEELEKMAALRFALNINPAGHQSQIFSSYSNELLRVVAPQFATDNDPAPVQIIPYSIGIIAASAVVGTIVFRKKDLN